jgi:hypothetical protein
MLGQWVLVASTVILETASCGRELLSAPDWNTSVLPPLIDLM